MPKKISQLLETTTASTLIDVLPIVSQGETKKITVSNILKYGNQYQGTDIKSLTSFWDSTYNTVLANSAINWNYQGTDVKSVSSNWQNAYTLVRLNSATTWNYQGTDIKELSSIWQDTYNIVASNSATTWVYDGTDIKDLSGNWQNTYTFLLNNSASFIDKDNTLSSLSGSWNSVYSTVLSNSASKWNYQGTDIKAVSGNWQRTFTTVSTNSANWIDSISNLNSLSGSWNESTSLVNSQSAAWNAGASSGIDTQLRSLSSNWETTYYNLSTKVSKTGDTMSGDLFVTKTNANIPTVTVNTTGANGVTTKLFSDTNQKGSVKTTSYHPLTLGAFDGDQIHITPDGYVGINNTTPSESLHVTGNALIQDANGSIISKSLSNQGVSIVKVDDSSSTSNVQIKQYGNDRTDFQFSLPLSSQGQLYFENCTYGVIGSNTSIPIVVATGGTEKFRITSQGNVGIGETNPTSKLQINSDNSTLALNIKQLGSGDYILLGDDTNPSNSPFIVKNDGKVGVGTKTPTTSLHVSGGNALIQGNITSTGTISSQNVVYAKDGNSDIWNDTTTQFSSISTNIVLDSDLATIVNNLVAQVTTPTAPSTITTNVTANSSYHDKTFMVNSASNLVITLPTGLSAGVEVTFIRQGTGTVTLSGGAGATVRSTPDNTFTKLAFTNSVASAYHSGSNIWYLFGDLIN